MPPTTRTPATVTLSALAFGLLGWATAHAVTDALLAHTHHDGSRHVHGYTLPLLVAGGSLAIASLVAVFVAAFASPSGRPGRDDASASTAGTSHSRRVRVRNASGLSATAYVTAELGEHLIAGDHRPPPTLVLLTGLAVYLVVGLGTSLLGQACTDTVAAAGQRLRRLLSTTDTAALRISATAFTLRTLQPSGAPHAPLGRGPPALPA